LGAPPRAQLPNNALLERAVREHIALFYADTQPGELAALRRLALTWMERLAALGPYLTGAVWNGTATRRSPIRLQLFCDDPKSAEITLIDQRLRYDVQTITGLRGEPVDVVLTVYDRDDLRGALKPGEDGQPARGDRTALLARMAAEAVDVGG
jgi:hypothetical protein